MKVLYAKQFYDFVSNIQIGTCLLYNKKQYFVSDAWPTTKNVILRENKKKDAKEIKLTYEMLPNITVLDKRYTDIYLSRILLRLSERKSRLNSVKKLLYLTARTEVSSIFKSRKYNDDYMKNTAPYWYYIVTSVTDKEIYMLGFREYDSMNHTIEELLQMSMENIEMTCKTHHKLSDLKETEIYIGTLQDFNIDSNLYLTKMRLMGKI